MTAQPSISLCMIVKNEESHLPGCLSSAAPYVDEIVVVDTGSNDRSIEIAKSFGARIHHFQWINDFSAARNESLRHATGGWVLQLDADERLNLLGSPNALRDAATDPNVDAYAVLVRCHHGERSNATYSVSHNLRFFRKLPGIQYDRPVHESVEPFLERSGGATAKASFLIEHEGYMVDGPALIRKLQRNLEILRHYVVREPNDPYGLYYLGQTYRALGEEQAGLEALKRGFQQQNASSSLKAMILNAMNLNYLGTIDYERIIDIATQSLEIQPKQNTARYFLGAAYYNQGRYREALPHLFSCYRYWILPVEEKSTFIAQEYTMNECDLLKSMITCFLHEKSYTNCIIYGQKLLKLDSADTEVHHIMGISFLYLQNYHMATKYLKNSIELGLQYEKAALAIAFSYYKLDQFDNCIKYFAKIREPDTGAVHESFRLLMLIVGEGKAAHLIKNVLIRKKDLLHQMAFDQLGQLISCLARHEYFEGLMTVFETIHQRTAEVESLLGGVIEYFADRNRLPELMPVLETLTEHYPRHTPFLVALGIVCIKRRNFFRAIETYLRLLELEPRNPAISRTLAGLYLSVGNKARALHFIDPY